MDTIRLIKNEHEYDKIMKEVIALAKNGLKPDSQEMNRFEILSLLIKDYDNKHYKILPPTPIEAIKFSMEQQHLSAKDMIKCFGTTSRFYEVINHKRKLSLNMIKKLHKNFEIPLESLIEA